MIVRIMETKAKAKRSEESSLEREVRDALGYLYGVPYLATHPLAGRLGIRGSVHPSQVGQQLQARLLEALEGLHPPPGQPEPPLLLRRYELMRLRYVEAMEIAAICKQLAISQTAYHRDHRKGLEAVVAVLTPREEQPAPEVPPPSETKAAQPAHGRSLFRRAFQAARGLAAGTAVASGLERVGWVAAQRGEYPKAQELLTAALGMHREAGVKEAEARCLEHLADLARLQRDPGRGAQLYEESIEAWQSFGDRAAAAAVLLKLGQLYLEDQQQDLAVRQLRRSLLIAVGEGLAETMAGCLRSFGELALREGQAARAARLWAACARLHGRAQATGAGEVRTKLGAKGFAVAWSQGQAMTLEEAVAEALQL